MRTDRLRTAPRRAAATVAWLAGAALAGACADAVLGADPSGDPAAVFDAAWQAYDRDFAFFADKGLDWDAAYRRHRPLVPAAGGTQAADSQLFAAVCALVAETGSLHSTLLAGSGAGARTCTAPVAAHPAASIRR